MDSSACSQTRAERPPTPRNLFEDSAWLYALCREYLFRDHTKQILDALFPDGEPAQGASVLEAGCGPGFYARKIARRFPNAAVYGLDRSTQMLCWARRKAAADGLANCHFLEGDVESLSAAMKPVDALVSSRLLLVVSDRQAVLTEMFRVLKPGGRLFLAEPTADLKSRLPLLAMRLTASLQTLSYRRSVPRNAQVLRSREFEALVRTQPWKECRVETLGDYQCAVCQKAPDAETAPAGVEANALVAGSVSA